MYVYYRETHQKMKNLPKGPLVMFSYFYQLLKHGAIVLITFGTLRYSPSFYSYYYYYYFFIIITSSGDIQPSTVISSQ